MRRSPLTPAASAPARARARTVLTGLALARTLLTGLARARTVLTGLALAATVLTSCARPGSAYEGVYAGADLAVPLAKPAVVLTDTDGDVFDLRAETDGRLTLVYFGYTNCPDICPIHLAQLSQVLDRPAMPADVAVVFITVDPERDDPDTIRRFLDAYDGDFIGLTGTVEEVEAAQLMFDVPLAERVETLDDDRYTFGHAGQVFAFAPDGVAYSVYPQGTRQTHWVRDLPLLAAITGEEAAEAAGAVVGEPAADGRSWDRRTAAGVEEDG